MFCEKSGYLPRRGPLDWRLACYNSCGNRAAAYGIRTVLEGVPWRGSAKGLISAGRLLVHAKNFMSDKFFIDTSILVYAHDRAARVKHERARSLIEKLWNSRGGMLSTQVPQEFCVNLRRRRKAAHPLSLEQTRRLLQDYLSWDVVTTRPSLGRGSGHRVSFTISRSGMRSSFKLLERPALRLSIQKTWQTGRPLWSASRRQPVEFTPITPVPNRKEWGVARPRRFRSFHCHRSICQRHGSSGTGSRSTRTATGTNSRVSGSGRWF
jgi:hypothetical protein